jgi:hypothetical protein
MPVGTPSPRVKRAVGWVETRLVSQTATSRTVFAALAAAHRAIDQLRREGKTVNYAAVAHAAGVSRAWLYRQDQIRDLISQLRDPKPPAAAQHASTDSLR